MKRLFAIVTMLVALVSACGKKGDPRAPELAAPRTITNLTARSEPKGVALIWSRPTEYVDGSALKDLASFVIFRKEVSETCPDCPVPYRQLTTVGVEDREKFVQKKQYRYDDRGSQAESHLPIPGFVAVVRRLVERAVQRSRSRTG